ncbi:flagellar biosynthetic protein FliR [Magnetovibrio sp. PR-2]|uniref:flagellar biosynthetic protein FliR n=1 Tax=Magnetovibrio sp. PR-2 TaxID=3120356 RepID=UPI002FCE22A7
MLSQIINLNLFAFLLVFCRVGGAMSVMPGFGAQQVPATVRLTFALLISFVLTPVLLPLLPGEPPSVSILFLLIIAELLVGVFFGLIPRIFMGAVHTSGTIMAMVASMANAFAQDPISESQSSVLSTFLSTTALTLIFVTNTHHLMLAAVVDSYAVFNPTEAPIIGDMTFYVAQRVADSFRIGLQMASPLVVSGLAYYIVLGIMGRLMPQLPVFFFGMPIQIALQVWILILSLSVMMMVFMRFFEDGLIAFTL